jgi:anti-sigma factor RsiW
MTTPSCDEVEHMISAYVDGELEAGARRRLEAHLQECPRCREELEEVQRLVAHSDGLASGLVVREEEWDVFVQNVYNQLERKTGWSLLIAGVVALAVWGLVVFVVQPWASPLVKGLLLLPALGLFLLFVSVLRQRLHAAKTDRYTREVHR